jgi:hypothetical protein
MRTKNIRIILLIVCLQITLSACKKLVQIDSPPDQISSKLVYSNDETATAAIRGIYSKMVSGDGFASGSANSVTILAGRSADDFSNYSSDEVNIQFSTNSLLPENTALRSGLWQEPYQVIYFANLALENLEASSLISNACKQQLQGEAKFIRAFCHFYLTNLFGDVPLILHTDYRINIQAFSSSKEQIYQQIIKDLTEAKSQLSDNYPSAERIRANKWAATALLARVYLYQREWLKAEKETSEVIAQNEKYQVLDDLNQVFLKNSQEAILQFARPLFYGYNTNEGNIFILIAAPTSVNFVGLTNNLIDAFETKDLRRSKWISTYASGSNVWYYPSKYKLRTGATNNTEYSMVLRLAEQYLIRSEARGMQNNFSGANDDLNKIRKRAGLDEATFKDQFSILNAIEKERRLELFSEWGHRWLDLKRTERATAVIAPLKTPNWQNTDALFPIPATELLNDKNLMQNEGY